MAISTLSDSNLSPAFKRVWGDFASNLYGTGGEDDFMKLVPKQYDFKGSQRDFPIQTSFGGGVGSGSLPTPNSAKTVLVTLTRKKHYARINIDRETMIASKGKEGAFIDATSFETEGKLNNFMRMMACWLWNDGTGILGNFSGNTSGTAAAPVVTIVTTGTYGFRRRFFEEGDYVNVYKASTGVLSSVFEITDVTEATPSVTLSRISGADDLTAIGAGTHSIVLQNSYNAAMSGMLGVCNFTSGSLYGATFARRLAPQRIDASVGSVNQPLSVDHFNRFAIEQKARSGRPFDLFVLSDKQMEKFLNRLGDKRRYVDMLSSANGISKVRVSFPALEVDTVGGPMKCVQSSFIHTDRVYGATLDEMRIEHAEKPQWVDDGSVFARLSDSDGFEARYCAYAEFYASSFHQGVIYNLATT